MIDTKGRVSSSLRRFQERVGNDVRTWSPRDWIVSLGSVFATFGLVVVAAGSPSNQAASPASASSAMQRAGDPLAAAYATLTGKVTDGLGRALPDIVVTAESPDLPVPVPSRADDQGNFRFRVLPPGNYDLTFILPPRPGHHEGFDCESGLRHSEQRSLPGQRFVRSVELSPGRLEEIVVVVEQPRPLVTVDCNTWSEVWWPLAEQ